MKFAAHVEVRLRGGIADPEGTTIERALPAMGFGDIHEVRAGRSFRFEVEAENEEVASSRVEELAERLLSNPVMQDTCLLSLVALDPGEG